MHAKARSAALVCVAMCAFAGNSVLCRLALLDGRIDGASFTALRIVSGAFALLALVAIRKRSLGWTELGSFPSALWLIAYALPFALAYLKLTAGTGALILFGFVQLTMIGHGVLSGERLRALKWLGLGLAIGGLVYLCAPGVEAPPLGSASLMAVAGIAWGFYSLRGRAVTDSVGESAGNFARAALVLVPAWLTLSLTGVLSGVLTREGVLLAVASGALTSGLGYAIWYAVLPALKASTAATVQLTVPIIAAVGGAVFVREALTVRLITASVVTLSGVLLAIVAGNKPATKQA